jgi:hypothetical protein
MPRSAPPAPIGSSLSPSSLLAALKARLGNPIIGFTKYGTVAALLSPKVALSIPGVSAGTAFEQAARAFVKAFPGLLGLDPDDALVAAKVGVSKVTGGAAVSFKVTRGGIPCHGAHATVMLDASRRFRGLLGASLPGGLPAGPAITSSLAASTALDPGETAVAPASLRYVDLHSERVPRLVWVVRVKGSAGAFDVWVDAVDGSRVARLPLAHSLDHVMLYDKNVQPAELVRDHGPSYDYCRYCQPPQDPTCAPLCSGMNPDETAAWAATNDSRSVMGLFGRWSWDNWGADTKVYLSTAEPDGHWYFIDNYVSLHTPALFTPAGGCPPGGHCWGPAYTSFYKEMTAHEWGHAVSDAISFDTTGEPLMLAQGFADCFALIVYTTDWIVGNPPPSGYSERDALLPMFVGGYRNLGRGLGSVDSGTVTVSHTCFASSVVDGPVPWPGDPPGSQGCNSSAECPADYPPFFDCVDHKCIVWSNLVPVTYQGRYSGGYAPIFNMASSREGYGGLLESSSTFEHLLLALTWAGCLYDSEVGQPFCERYGTTLLASALAAGLYDSPVPLMPGGGTHINTDRQHRQAAGNAAEGPSTAQRAELSGHLLSRPCRQRPGQVRLRELRG